MKDSRRVFILIEVTLAGILILVTAAMLREYRGREPDRIAVILQEPDASRWAAFKYGLRAAAEDAGVDVLIVSAGEQPDAGEEETALEREIVNGADAVILQLHPDGGTVGLLERIDGRVPVMVTGCPSFAKEGVSAAATGPDNYAMGAALAEELLADCGGSLAGRTVGLLSDMAEAEEGKDRESGFTGALKEAGGTVAWSVQNSGQDGWEELLEAQEPVDFVICLDDSSLVAAGKEAGANNLHGALVYGIGHSTEAVYQLDMGNAECLVVPDEFNVGYQSVTEVARRLQSRFYDMKDTTVSHIMLYRETLFSRENQELLFSMSQ
ncbi:sugar-binding domain protein [Marvinbryantia formatexigens DSM 14469]|uniref:Sugar-binding domain protein n=1 Tax=Marvinbryantia formatexigens DSM 14469 TaxID=478749 RepID=C6LHJ5_9FIRM|nr:substrate-binding domain-containing protein [Marvinbryantia formatexigens]EET59982.1 sugar-binding domain protein [Marvinbryantia formatexigens DSM 14469]UWO25863.1 substrate-binding domain-containing protein [Marvinbryantia formatexigens DSM 14469]SDF40601.1 ribose transport system substrate-binding protein [Marvinbryantia formatexigens]